MAQTLNTATALRLCSAACLEQWFSLPVHRSALPSLTEGGVGGPRAALAGSSIAPAAQELSVVVEQQWGVGVGAACRCLRASPRLPRLLQGHRARRGRLTASSTQCWDGTCSAWLSTRAGPAPAALLLHRAGVRADLYGKGLLSAELKSTARFAEE